MNTAHIGLLERPERYALPAASTVAAAALLPAETPADQSYPAAPGIDASYAETRLITALDSLDADDVVALTPAQMIDLALPGVTMSRFARYRFLGALARSLESRCFGLVHNRQRGAAARFILTRTARAAQ